MAIKPTATIDDRIREIIHDETDANTREDSLREKYPEAFKEIDALAKLRKDIAERKDSVKADLIEEGDFDTHQIDNYNISVSRIVKLDVLDADEVDDEFKDVQTVIDLKKAQEYKKVMRKTPKGFEDKTTFRLNWKEVKYAK